MVYPKFKEKHLHEALFHPVTFVSYKKFKKQLPKKYILTYQSHALNYFKRKYKLKKIKFLGSEEIYVFGDVGLVKIKGIGAPNVITVFEELIAVGGKEFINVGTAGGLHHQGIFLCNKALRDEGTSYHYIPHGDYSYPDLRLTERLGKFIKKQGLEYFEGTTWTIDAPYRETKAEVEKYARKGIVTVEMEASALFAVAKYRKVRIASAFVVSDILRDKWEPMFHKFNIKQAQNRLIDAAISCLKS